jgi:DNA-binding response OmpR family regulator
MGALSVAVRNPLHRRSSLLTRWTKRRCLVTHGDRGRIAVVIGDVPLVVCVSADVSVRERVVRRLDDCGTVVVCTDLAELRAMLFPPPSDEPTDQPGPVVLGALVVDTRGHLVTWQDEPLALTRLERELLARLASPPVGVWTYERLFGSVWGGAYLGDTAILHSAVKRMRRKLRAAEGGPEVQTVRGVGYRLAARS